VVLLLRRTRIAELLQLAIERERERGLLALGIYLEPSVNSLQLAAPISCIVTVQLKC
jgi:hypothetical protein